MNWPHKLPQLSSRQARDDRKQCGRRSRGYVSITVPQTEYD